MPRHDHALPVSARMSRVAIVAPANRLRETLAIVADAGLVELAGPLAPANGEAIEALRRLERAGAPTPEPLLSPQPLDVPAAERTAAAALLAGEAELQRRAAAAVDHGSFAALVGWVPTDGLATLSARLAGCGSAAVELPRQSWLEPPTLIGEARLVRPFRALVETYGPGRYADLDPTLFATVAFVLMFGMMFGDVGHGLLLALAGLALRAVRRGRLHRVRAAWQLVFLCGLSSAFFGLVYGEFFGPTGIVPKLWLDPVDRPVPLLAAAVAIGGVLLANSYAIGIVNRWREQGASAALIAPSGVAGAAVFLGGIALAGGLYADALLLTLAGGAVLVAGLVLLAVGFALEAGRGPLAVTQAGIETVDAAVRVGASAISFTRLAAFGLMHAAIAAVVWNAASAVWGSAAGAVAAALVLLLGTVLALSLELLVTGIQALRLEYYELFSRIFAGQGRAFAPWHIPLSSGKGTS